MTKKSNKNADRIFKNYLKEYGYANADYIHYSEDDFDHILLKFWFAGWFIGITKNPRFLNSQKAYKEACLQLKAARKAVVKSYPKIKHAGMFPNFQLCLLFIYTNSL